MTKHRYAQYLLFITLGHFIIGLLLFQAPLLNIIASGWVNVVGPNNLHEAAAAWFMLFSWPLLMLVIQFWNKQENVSLAIIKAGIIGAVIGVSLMPMSGFWLMLMLNLLALNKKTIPKALTNS